MKYRFRFGLRRKLAAALESLEDGRASTARLEEAAKADDRELYLRTYGAREALQFIGSVVVKEEKR